MNLVLLSQTAHSQVAKHAGEVGQHLAEHSEHAEHAEHAAPHVVNWVTLLAKSLAPSVLSDALVQYEKVIYSAIAVAIIAIFSIAVSKKMSLVPGRKQVVLESIVLWLDDLVCGVTGPEGRKFTPFIGALFTFILVSNLWGLVPLQNSATAYITTTAPLAFSVFFYVQWVGLSRNGFRGYMYHLMGSPKDVIGFALIPLNFPLHILGEFSKPISLMFRLYGNVMAGHILVAVFLGLGLDMLKSLHVPIGIPLHFPFLFLEILVGLIQAFVFSLLTTVYIAMMLPHDHEEHAEAHA